MRFDAEEHRKRLEIIRYGRRKWPDERNITILYKRAYEDLGVESKVITTSMANHLPTPEESARENPKSKFTIICPKCNKKTFYLTGLCKGCRDSEEGKYKTIFKCFECKYQEKSKEPLVIWLQRLGIDFGTQTKESLGIKTLTDGGLK